MKVRIYMEEKNTELLFTDENILKALMKTSPENRRNLLAMEYNNLFYMANDSECAQRSLEICDEYIEGYRKIKDGICEFLEKIQEQATENAITEMTNIYKELSREERLEFCKKLQEESTIENSLDMFEHTWKSMISKLQKAVKV